ncbi:hypothetical protein EUX98_g8399 [Antrodiella citrinella]|uniref:Uncharacterized protein n=1 Tax=Antrodiella citrinella TaxID=2447956 RepID=A0A4V3XGH3_9APHY|nr:hypothetical protein EUX98_g8399 [Antrodiella citrinella]
MSLEATSAELEPPAGVKIIPFKDFKPKGIIVKIDPDSPDAEEPEVEVDAEGIPTVALPVKHELTEAEQSKKKKRKKTAALVTVNGVVRRPTWFEEWEEGESFRRTTVNPYVAFSFLSLSFNIIYWHTRVTSKVDRFHQAAQEFKSGRSWPPSSNGLLGLWDAFRLYVGIIGSIQPPPSKKRFAHQPQPDDEDDDDLGEDMNMVDQKVVVMDPETAQAKRRADEEIAIEERRQNLSEEANARIVKRHELKDARMDFFLNDPEMAMMIFFSAHFRDRGLMWEKVRCRDGPILVQFFLEYVLRSRVFPELEKEMKKALDVVKKARKELPLTYVLGGILPDSLNDRFVSLFGSMSQKAVWGPEDAENLARFRDEQSKIEEEKKHREEEAREEEKKRFAEFIASNPGGDTVQTIDPDDPSLNLPEEMQKDAIADNADVNGVEVAPTVGWGTTPTWGDATVATGWEANTAAADTWGDPMAEDSTWSDNNNGMRDSLVQLLGPTVLPHTHTTGIVESSTRKIVEIVSPPTSGFGRGKKAKKGRSTAEVVEEDLEQRFGYIVLAPWTKIGNHSNSDITAPKFLPDSRGLVMDTQTKASTENMETDTGVAPHDPTKDLIRILVTADAVKQLAETIGMGMSASWVQLVRRDHTNESEDEDIKGSEEPDVLDKNRRLGATGVNGTPTKWWYMEQQVATFASFHADRQYDDQD